MRNIQNIPNATGNPLHNQNQSNLNAANVVPRPSGTNVSDTSSQSNENEIDTAVRRPSQQTRDSTNSEETTHNPMIESAETREAFEPRKDNKKKILVVGGMRRNNTNTNNTQSNNPIYILFDKLVKYLFRSIQYTYEVSFVKEYPPKSLYDFLRIIRKSKTNTSSHVPTSTKQDIINSFSSDILVRMHPRLYDELDVVITPTDVIYGFENIVLNHENMTQYLKKKEINFIPCNALIDDFPYEDIGKLYPKNIHLYHQLYLDKTQYKKLYKSVYRTYFLYAIFVMNKYQGKRIYHDTVISDQRNSPKGYLCVIQRDNISHTNNTLVLRNVMEVIYDHGSENKELRTLPESMSNEDFQVNESIHDVYLIDMNHRYMKDETGTSAILSLWSCIQ